MISHIRWKKSIITIIKWYFSTIPVSFFLLFLKQKSHIKASIIIPLLLIHTFNRAKENSFLHVNTKICNKSELNLTFPCNTGTHSNLPHRTWGVCLWHSDGPHRPAAGVINISYPAKGNIKYNHSIKQNNRPCISAFLFCPSVKYYDNCDHHTLW